MSANGLDGSIHWTHARTYKRGRRRGVPLSTPPQRLLALTLVHSHRTSWFRVNRSTTYSLIFYGASKPRKTCSVYIHSNSQHFENPMKRVASVVSAGIEAYILLNFTHYCQFYFNEITAKLKNGPLSPSPTWKGSLPSSASAARIS